MKKGDIISLEIEKYAFEGKGIAKINVPGNSGEKNYVVFVDGAYPGDKVSAKLTKIKKSYAEAKVQAVILPSAGRIQARCKYFGICGGCRQQDLNYESQIIYKQNQVVEIFTKMGGFKDFKIEPIIPAENIFYYRNKMEFSFANRRWHHDLQDLQDFREEEIALGLHVPNIYDKVLDIEECFLQSRLSNDILNFIRKYFKEKGSTVYSIRTHSGYLRNLVIRTSFHTKDLMVNLVTSGENESLMKEFANNLIEKFQEITTVVNNINLKKAAIAVGDYEKVYFGEGFIFDYIGRYRFRISANSFFQTNTLQAEKLYQTALDFAELTGREIVYDLYSGAGTISIFISGNAKAVYGFENVESAVKDAEENKKLNEIENVHFINADLYKSFLSKIELREIPEPDVLILDPPRSGMHKTTVEDVIQLSPLKIVYVSCNPATQVRDIKLFAEAGYKLIKIRPVDMFPHSYHIENVALLIKENNR
ncbi:MAG TPA: 23S rRNA (uracil(1939)-C(5))-methyltransferase RlmD [Ignavibacteriaceae bacterium]|nr:23S rRNA (uracil(1939)-C(5))-methyltransferase RlmD [Ignavibacteriaceae bacterium]